MTPESTISRSNSGTVCRKPRAGAVVPAAVEDHHFTRCRQVRHIALAVHLGLLALGRRRQRNDAEDARAHAFGDGLDGAALARAVTALEDDADLQALVHHPLLQRHQFRVQLLQFALVGLARELAARGGGVGLAVAGNRSVDIDALTFARGGVLPVGDLLCHLCLQGIDPVCVETAATTLPMHAGHSRLGSRTIIAPAHTLSEPPRSLCRWTIPDIGCTFPDTRRSGNEPESMAQDESAKGRRAARMMTPQALDGKQR
jgi:hypothetical protein